MKILVLSAHTPSLFWFRIDMMKSFIEAGHTVIAIGPGLEIEWKGKFSEFQIEYKHVNIDRNGLNLFKDYKTYKSFKKIMSLEKPDLVFSYQAKTVVYGSLAAKKEKVPEFYSMIAGLGSILRGSGIKNSILKSLMLIQYKIASKLSEKVIFQNKDDRDFFIDRRILEIHKTEIVNGSGVNLQQFSKCDLPTEICFIFIGRLIRDKGIIEYLQAAKKVKESHPNTRFMLVGPFDSNPTSINPIELEKYTENKIIEYYGEQDDIRPFLKQATTLVLPSYHEGTPKTILEAMACGRSIITTDAPGCRETIVDGYNGYQIKVKNTDDLIEKLLKTIRNKNKIVEFGENSFKIAKERYDVDLVNKNIMQIMKLIN